MNHTKRRIWIAVVAALAVVAVGCRTTDADNADTAGKPVEPVQAVAGSQARTSDAWEPALDLNDNTDPDPDTDVDSDPRVDVTLPGEGIISTSVNGPGPEDSISTDSTVITIHQIGVTTVVPSGWTESPGGGYTDGTSQLGVFALETTQVTDPMLDGFEPAGETTGGGHNWVLFTQQDNDEFVVLALTEIGPLTYGFVLQAPAELAESLGYTVVMPALEAFQATSPPLEVDPYGGIEIDKVDIAGHAVAYVAEGAGPPTVVFEAGLGNGMTSWAAVFPEVAEHARAFAYDRPGYGDSDLTDTPRDGATMVAELRELLIATGHEPPYLLVGHSLGGTLMDLFARTYPDDVAGVVLVDSRHQEFSARCLVRLGEAECDVSSDAEVEAAPEPIRGEWLGMADTVRQISDAPPFPEVPLTVIIAGISDATPAYSELWHETQQDYADMVPGSQLLIAERSDHGIPVQQPEIVIDAIVEILQGAS